MSASDDDLKFWEHVYLQAVRSGRDTTVAHDMACTAAEQRRLYQSERQRLREKYPARKKP